MKNFLFTFLIAFSFIFNQVLAAEIEFENNGKAISCDFEKDYFYSCQVENGKIFIRYSGQGQPLLGVVKLDSGKLIPIQINNYKVDKNDFSINLLNRNFRPTDFNNQIIFKDLQEKNLFYLSIHPDFFDFLENEHSTIFKQLNRDITQFQYNLFKKQLGISHQMVNGQCQPIDTNNECFIQKCQMDDGRQKFLLFDREFPSDLPPYIFSFNQQGEFSNLETVDKITLNGINQAFIENSQDNYNYQKEISDAKNIDPYSFEMKWTRTIPPAFKKRPEMYDLLVNKSAGKVLTDAVTKCSLGIKNKVRRGISKFEEFISTIEMVQFITNTNDNLESFLISPTAVPNKSCNIGQSYLDPKIKPILEKFLPEGEKKTISLKKAKKLFDQQAKRSDISWNYQDDGCFARAHLMTRDFKKSGVTSDKVWARGDFKIIAKDGHLIEWNYHVAPIVYVKQNGKVEKYVIDPSVADEPVTVEDWLNRFSSGNIPRYESIYPLVKSEYTEGLNRTIIAYSSSLPIYPEMESVNMTEAERNKSAVEVMKMFKKP